MSWLPLHHVTVVFVDFINLGIVVSDCHQHYHFDQAKYFLINTGSQEAAGQSRFVINAQCHYCLDLSLPTTTHMSSTQSTTTLIVIGFDAGSKEAAGQCGCDGEGPRGGYEVAPPARPPGRPPLSHGHPPCQTLCSWASNW